MQTTHRCYFLLSTQEVKTEKHVSIQIHYVQLFVQVLYQQCVQKVLLQSCRYEHIARADVVSVYERFIKDVINGFSIPDALPCHLVDEVYIPINYDGEFHWVLAVVVLRKRLIRVYDSSLRSRKKVQSCEIKQLSMILPNNLQDSGFFEKKDKIDWAALDAYKDNKTGELLGPQHRLRWNLLKTLCNKKVIPLIAKRM